MKKGKKVGKSSKSKGGGSSKKDMGLKLLAVGAGFFFGDSINGAIDKMIPPKTTTTPGSTTPQVSPNNTVAIIGELGLGGLMMLKAKRGTMGKVLGMGGALLVGAGLKRSLKVAGVIKGYQNVPVIGKRRMAGYHQVPVIGGAVPAQLAGSTRPGQLQGFTVGAYNSQGSAVMGSVMSGSSGSGIMTSSDYMN